MFRNHLRSAIRILIQNRSYSAINILGLALGLTAYTVARRTKEIGVPKCWAHP